MIMPDETLDEKVQYHEPFVFRVVRSLRQRHFEVAQVVREEIMANGYFILGAKYSIVGSAKDKPLLILEPLVLQEKILFGLLGNRKRQCYRHLGSLGSWDDELDKISSPGSWYDEWDENLSSPQTKTNEKWGLEVYGRENIPPLTQLAKELSDEYHVKINVCLQTEDQRLLTFNRDNYLVAYYH